MKKKRILLLGGAAQNCKIIEAAHQIGVEVYVTDYLPLEKAPAKQIADKSFFVDIFNIEEIVALCKKENIDGVLSVCLDACQIPYQKICEALGFPCFGNEEQFQCLTDKKKFKKCCTEYGVDTIPEYTLNQILDESDIVEYPVLVKPVYSRGSRGQTVCYNKESVVEAMEFAKSESSDGDALIEKYMENKNDFTVSYLVKDGEVFLTRSADRYIGSAEDKMEKVCIAAISPSKYIDIYFKYAHQNMVKMIKGIGLKNAPVFFQAFVDGNVVRFYDPGLRFAGGEYERFYEKVYGKNLMKYLIEFSLYGEMKSFNKSDIDDKATLNGYYAINLQTAIRPGSIKKIDGLEKIQEKNTVLSVYPKYQEGDTVLSCYNVNQRFAEIDIIAKSPESLKTEVVEIQSLLKVFDNNGEDMIFAKFDPDIIDQYVCRGKNDNCDL